MRDEIQENLGICLVLFTEGSITLVQAYVTLGGTTQKKKIGGAGLASQTTHLYGVLLAWEQTPLFHELWAQA